MSSNTVPDRSGLSRRRPKTARGDRDVVFWERALAERAELLHSLSDPTLGAGIETLARLIVTAFSAGRKVVLFGNGGSAATAQHAAAELVGRFETERRALP